MVQEIPRPCLRHRAQWHWSWHPGRRAAQCLAHPRLRLAQHADDPWNFRRPLAACECRADVSSASEGGRNEGRTRSMGKSADSTVLAGLLVADVHRHTGIHRHDLFACARREGGRGKRFGRGAGRLHWRREYCLPARAERSGGETWGDASVSIQLRMHRCSVRALDLRIFLSDAGLLCGGAGNRVWRSGFTDSGGRDRNFRSREYRRTVRTTSDVLRRRSCNRTAGCRSAGGSQPPLS